MKRGERPSRVIRQYYALYWVIAGVLAAYLVGFMVAAAHDGKPIWPYLLISLPGVALVWGALRIRVEISDDACRIVNFYASMTIPWAEIERFSFEGGALPFGMQGYCIRRDGSRVPIQAIQAKQVSVRRDSTISPDLVRELNRLLTERRRSSG